MKKNYINSNLFNLDFFLSNSTIVTSLEKGAKLYGGCTKVQDKYISNIEGNEFIEVNNVSNSLSVFVPSTVNVNEEINNITYVKKYYKAIQSRYGVEKNIFIENTLGSWYSEDNKQVVKEKITILSIELTKVNKLDIAFFVELARQIKKDMQQEGVSVNVNNSLLIA